MKEQTGSITSFSSKMYTSQNPAQSWWHFMEAAGVTALSAGCLKGGHTEFMFFFFSLFALVYFSWKEMLQNSSHVTPEQKEMSEQILSVVFWLSVGQSESCKVTLVPELGVFSFHCGAVRACWSFNERSSTNVWKQVPSVLSFYRDIFRATSVS